MCRLFAQISPRPERARDLLVDSDFSLLRQSDWDPANPQKDGWGLAWFGADGRPRVRKSGKPASSERALFERTSEDAVSGVVLGHIRAASAGIDIDEAHAHPFQDDGWIFIHNGTITIHREVAKALGPRRASLKTDSDSEVYLQQFLKHLCATGDASRAFEECVREDWLLWTGCRDLYPHACAPYTSLNAIASDGKGLHALCHAARRGPAEHSICRLDQPWSVMSFGMRGGRFVLASEGIDGGEWERLVPPETISAVPTGDTIEVRRRALRLEGPLGPIPEVSRQ
ncbi:MAG TPA: hypothetical protein DCZ01_06825 [Elusimicrobia bacterium]|nr:MAG: hypothetical protein A2X37_01640 [Elusimicrobia bacterium GWA2_66_18]HAZ08223.1 hypothetical protein [Elusimicrobiota bacterium]